MSQCLQVEVEEKDHQKIVEFKQLAKCMETWNKMKF
jgi:hypothetical protein